MRSFTTIRKITLSRYVRILLSAILFAAVCTLLLTVRPFMASDRGDDGFVFEVAMAAAQGGEARLFYDIGNGVQPRDSVGITVAPGDQPAVQRVPLPFGVYRRLWLDLLNRDGEVTFVAARIVSPQGDVVRTFRGGDLQLTQPSRGGSTGLKVQTVASGPPEVAFILSEPLVLDQGWPGDWVGVVVPFIALFFLFGILLLRVDRWMVARNIDLAEVGGRWISVAQRRPGRTLAIFAVAGTVLSCYPVVFFGKSFVSPNYQAIYMLYPGFPTVPGDTGKRQENTGGADMGAMLWQNLPYSVVQNHALVRDGELPLWNRYNAAGVPLLGQGISMLGDPLHTIVVAAGGASWAWDLKYLLAKTLFCLGLGWLVFRTTKHLPTAMLLTLSAAFIGFFSYRFNHPAFFSMCYAPWILLSWVEITRASTVRSAVGWILLLLLADWAQLNSGTVKEAYMLLASLHGTGLLIFVLSGGEGRRGKWGHLAFAGGIFALLSAPVWWTFIDALQKSYTAYDETRSWQIQPGLLIGFFDDIFYRKANAAGGVFDPSANFLILFGCLLALTFVRSLLRDRVFVALAIGALPTFALAFGVVPPELIGAIPILKNVGHVDNTFSCALIVHLIALAGFGLKRGWERMTAQDWPVDYALTAVGMGALLSLYFGFTQAHQRVPIFFEPVGLGSDANPFFQYYCVSIIVATLALPWLIRSVVCRSPQAFLAVPLAALCFLTIHWRHGMHVATHLTDIDYFVMNPEVRTNLQARSPAIEYIKQQEGAFRTVGFGNTFYPGYNTLVGLESIYGTDPLINPYYRELLFAGGIRQIWTWRWVVEKDNLVATLPLYRLLNNRFFLDSPSEASKLPLKPHAGLDVMVYEDEAAWPRAFFVDQVDSYGKLKDFVRLIQKGDGQPFAAIQEGTGVNGVEVSPGGQRHIVAAQNYRLSTNQTRFTIQAPGPGVVVLTEAYMPGDFIVKINGSRADYFRVNHAFRGVKIPQAGTYEISFSYWPAHFTASLLMSALGLALLVAWLIVVFRRRKISDPMPAPAQELLPVSHD